MFKHETILLRENIFLGEDFRVEILIYFFNLWIR